MPENARPDSSRRAPLSKRSFLKAAVAIGGTSALAACFEREAGVEIPQGPDDLSGHPDRQHAWNRVLPTDEQGNTRNARHHVLRYFSYRNSDQPTESDRQRLEQTFETLEHAYARSNDGLLFTVGYSPAYFERFDAELPEAVHLPEPRALASFEDPSLDEQDIVVHLASDHAKVVLAADEALAGNRDSLNGVTLDTTPEAVLEPVDRRTGFIGAGLPAENQDVVGIPDDEPVSEDAPLYMGFRSGFEKNQASEDRVSLQSGPFEDATTQHISTIDLLLDQWYDQDSRDQRVSKMFCPAHAENDTVEGVGTNLGRSSQLDDCTDASVAARDDGTVGHSQKLVSAREDDSPVILRRDFDSTDGGRAGLHFLALQRSIDAFTSTRDAMNGEELDGVGQKRNNGILQYLDVERRGNFLLPPRPIRSLPTPTGR